MSRGASRRSNGRRNVVPQLGGTGRSADDLYQLAHHEVSDKPHLQPRAIALGLAGVLMAELVWWGSLWVRPDAVVVDDPTPPDCAFTPRVRILPGLDSSRPLTADGAALAGLAAACGLGPQMLLYAPPKATRPNLDEVMAQLGPDLRHLIAETQAAVDARCFPSHMTAPSNPLLTRSRSMSGIHTAACIPRTVSLALARDRLGGSTVLGFLLADVASLTVAAGVIPTAYATTGLPAIPAAFIAMILALFAVGSGRPRHMGGTRHLRRGRRDRARGRADPQIPAAPDLRHGFVHTTVDRAAAALWLLVGPGGPVPHAPGVIAGVRYLQHLDHPAKVSAGRFLARKPPSCDPWAPNSCEGNP